MNVWARLGSIALMAGAVGHFLIVDVSFWIGQAAYVSTRPEGVLDFARNAVVDWGLLGSTGFLHAFAGFSVWMVVSLIIIALYNLLLFRELPPGHLLRSRSLTLGLIGSVLFLGIASFCFIYPAVIGAGLAVTCFILAIRKERALPRA